MHKDHVIDVLNDLIETCEDGEQGFRAAAEHARGDALRTLLLSRADECRQATGELQSMVAFYGGQPRTGGTLGGALHRGWVAVRTRLTDRDNPVILEECERGEDVALASYRKTLDGELPAEVRALVQRQYEAVKRSHERIRSLRDEARATH